MTNPRTRSLRRLRRGRPALAAAVALAGAASAQLAAVAVDPPRNALAASTATNVVVQLDAPVDPGSVTPATFVVFGRWSGVRPGTTTVAGATVTWRPERPFFPGEEVNVALSAGVTSTTGAPLAGGFAYEFWTRSNPGTDAYALAGVVPVRFPGEGLVQSYGLYAGDLDRDGAPDLSIPNEVADDVRVLRNDGCGAYGVPEPTPVPDGSVPSANEGADLDGDGWTDFVVANIGGDTVSVLINDGAGAYLPSVTYASGDASRGVAVLDLEADGDGDLAVALRNESKVALHLNQGDGTFAPPVKIEAGVLGETSIAAVDADGDGRSDLFVGGYDSDTLACLLATGGGAFTTADTQGVPGRPWQIAAGDVDGDGDVDAALCCSSASAATIVRGDGAGGLGPAESYPVGQFPLAIDLGDADGDGDLDMIASSYAAGTWTHYRNDGAGNFSGATTLDATFAASCMVLVDDDRDGDLDLIGVDEISDEVFLYRQVSPVPAGVEAGACDARLRVNELAGRAGFGALPPHPLSLAERAFLGVTAPPATAWAIGVGPPLAPGAPTAFGLLNLAPAFPLVAGVTDASGEALAPVDLPPSLAIGSTAALQGFTLAGALTNPEQVVVAP